MADSSEQMLADPDAVKRLAELRKVDKGVFNKVKRFIRDFAQKIRDLYKSMKPDSAEARYVSTMLEAFDQLQEMWLEGVTGAAENYGKAEVTQVEAKTAEKNSIRETEDGRMVAVVDNDILSHIDTSTWDSAKVEQAKTAARHELSKFSEGITVNGITRKVNKASKKEFTRSKYTQHLVNSDKNTFADKMRMADVVSDIVKVTSGWGADGGLVHPRSDSFIDFDHGTALVKSGDNQYSVEVVVGITNSGEYVFYDVTSIHPDSYKIKEESNTNATTDKPIGAVNMDSSEGMVAHQNDSVKLSARESASEVRKQWDEEAKAMEASHRYDFQQQRKEIIAEYEKKLKEVRKQWNEEAEAIIKSKDYDRREDLKQQRKELQQKYEADVKQLSGEYEQKLNALKVSRDAEVAVLNARMEQDRLTMKRDAEKAMKEARADFQKRRAMAVESRNRTAVRHKIQNVVQDLNQMLLHEDKKHHVPEEMKAAVAAAFYALSTLLCICRL